jgi:DNA polymerase IV
MEKLILHCDLNSFFATASLVDKPELHNVPVAVAGDPTKRHGIILAKNMPAKKYGVQTAEPIWKSMQKCPELTILPPDYQLYIKYSEMVKDIYYRYTGNIEPFGIDECWLDISAYKKGIEYGEKIAHEIREVVKEETKLTLSAGVSFSKIFAKLGSDYKKPDAVTVISKDNYKDIAWPLPVGDLLYVGRATKRKLSRIAVTTIGNLANTPPEVLKRLLGKNGLMLKDFANGNDGSMVKAIDHGFGFKGIGNSMTTKRDLVNDRDVFMAFLMLSEMVAKRMRAKGVATGCLSIYLRDKNLKHITRQRHLYEPTFISDEITEVCMELYYDHWDIRLRPIRSLGIRSTDFTLIVSNRQLSFFDSLKRSEKEDLEFAKDKILAKYGKGAIVRAVFMDKTAPKERLQAELHDVHPLSFFRK